jgi:hypothetical protein
MSLYSSSEGWYLIAHILYSKVLYTTPPACNSNAQLIYALLRAEGSGEDY